jgi:VIT1/CCC1 family predicted Fe2+/Mn2+ transporter
MINIQKWSLGATAAIITSMGLIAGLNQGDNARAGIITGLLIVGLADNISDSFGFLIYKESEGASRHDLGSYTSVNFIVRLFLVLTFVLIVFLFSSNAALIVSSVWGLVLLAILSYLIAKSRKISSFRIVVWHLVIALMVVAGSKLLGNLISKIIIRS